MTFSKEIIAIANSLRLRVQRKTKTISEGEGVAMVLLWSFLCDHAEYEGEDVEQLAHHQLDAFIEYAREKLSIRRGGQWPQHPMPKEPPK